MWKRGERKQVLVERRGKKVQNVLRRERETIEHMKWMYRNERERERERKEPGRNTGWRRKGDKMDERDMEKKGKEKK
jgi:hypothetical protein